MIRKLDGYTIQGRFTFSVALDPEEVEKEFKGDAGLLDDTLDHDLCLTLHRELEKYVQGIPGLYASQINGFEITMP